MQIIDEIFEFCIDADNTESEPRSQRDASVADTEVDSGSTKAEDKNAVSQVVLVAPVHHSTLPESTSHFPVPSPVSKLHKILFWYGYNDDSDSEESEGCARKDDGMAVSWFSSFKYSS